MMNKDSNLSVRNTKSMSDIKTIVVDGVEYQEVKKKKELPKNWSEMGFVGGYCVKNNYTHHFAYKIGSFVERKSTFATEEQAEASIALAQLSQLMKVYNDGRDPDWKSKEYKYTIDFYEDSIQQSVVTFNQCFLSFKTAGLRDEFLENFKDLIQQAKPLL